MQIKELTVSALGRDAKLRVFLRDNMGYAPDRKRPLVLICPGGAYAYTSEREAEPIALWYVGRGFHAAILYYSCSEAVKTTDEAGRAVYSSDTEFPTALCQLAEAVSLIRSNSREWCVDPKKLIVCGFSAGGHLALSLGTFWNSGLLAGLLKAPASDRRPDGLVLAYPVVSSGEFRHDGSFVNLLGSRYADEELMEMVSLEKQVSADTPPTFVWTTNEDEGVPAENSLFLALALRKAGVSAELHMYPRGGHGLSLSNEELNPNGAPEEVQAWIGRSAEWIESL